MHLQSDDALAAGLFRVFVVNFTHQLIVDPQLDLAADRRHLVFVPFVSSDDFL